MRRRMSVVENNHRTEGRRGFLVGSETTAPLGGQEIGVLDPFHLPQEVMTNESTPDPDEQSIASIECDSVPLAWHVNPSVLLVV